MVVVVKNTDSRRRHSLARLFARLFPALGLPSHALRPVVRQSGGRTRFTAPSPSSSSSAKKKNNNNTALLLVLTPEQEEEAERRRRKKGGNKRHQRTRDEYRERKRAQAHVDAAYDAFATDVCAWPSVATHDFIARDDDGVRLPNRSAPLTLDDATLREWAAAPLPLLFVL